MDDSAWLRLVVTGSREYREKREVFRVLDAIHARWPVRLLGEGGCRRYDKDRNLRPVSADLYAHWWCEYRGVTCLTVFARWAAEGRAAGPRRNERMLDLVNPHIVVAFPGGDGTRNIVQVAVNAGFRQMEAETPPATLFLSPILPASFTGRQSERPSV